MMFEANGKSGTMTVKYHNKGLWEGDDCVSEPLAIGPKDVRHCG